MIRNGVHSVNTEQIIVRALKLRSSLGVGPSQARLGSLHLWKKISKSSARARLGDLLARKLTIWLVTI